MTDKQIEEKALEAYPRLNTPWETRIQMEESKARNYKREGYIRALKEIEAESPKKTLKSVIDNTYLLEGIIALAQDPTIISKKEQIEGLLFNALADDYWDYVKSLPKIKGWIARDERCNLLCLYTQKPKRENGYWILNGGGVIELEGDDFPDITWESEPLKVEMIINKL